MRRRPEVDDLRLGIVGAGKFGTTLARAAVAAGYDVAISGSGPADDIALTVDVLAPGARAVTTDEVVRHADIIVLAVPTHRFRELPRDLFAGKILIDAMNYWEPVDGDDPELAAAPDGTSTVVQAALPLRPRGQEPQPARLPRARREPAPTRRARPHRRSAPPATTAWPSGAVMRLVDRLGFDPVDAGPLDERLALEPDGSPFAITYSADQLSRLVQVVRDREVAVPTGDTGKQGERL